MTESRISLFWYSRRVNFGDGLSPLIVRALSGKDLVPFLSESVSSPRFLALGSILHCASDGDIVWGAGFRDDYPMKATCLDVRAVRGPLTRKNLLERTIGCPEIYGDPAILMPYLFRPINKRKKYQVGIIKHYADRTDFKMFRKAYDLKEIDVRLPPLKVIKEICECEIILSSSLHGLIIAEAYGVPACWLSPEKGMWLKPEPIIKYHDYYLSTSREPVTYQYSQQSLDVSAAIRAALDSKKPVFDCNKLLMSFPFLRQEISSVNDLARFPIQEDIWGVLPYGLLRVLKMSAKLGQLKSFLLMVRRKFANKIKVGRSADVS